MVSFPEHPTAKAQWVGRREDDTSPVRMPPYPKADQDNRHKCRQKSQLTLTCTCVYTHLSKKATNPPKGNAQDPHGVMGEQAM